MTIVALPLCGCDAIDCREIADTGTLGGVEFAGWRYRLFRDCDGRPQIIGDGSMLVMAWPTDSRQIHTPGALAVRQLFVPVDWLEVAV